MAVALFSGLGSGALVWHFAPRQNESLADSYYQLQRENQDLRAQLATRQGELAVANGQISSLKVELAASQQRTETLEQKQIMYESILQARSLDGVHLLRAAAHMDTSGTGADVKRLFYSIVLVQGGNYPYRVTGSLRITALGKNGQQQVLQLGKKGPELPYVMGAQAFLSGNVIWQQDWQPVKLHITRFNAKGEERDQMDIALDGENS